MLHRIKSTQVDYLNIFLIVASLALSIIFPFELFILAYAILGPLHYLTEIKWLDGKKYFTTWKPTIWILTILALGFSIPFILQLPFFKNQHLKEISFFLSNYTNNLILIALVISIALIFFKNIKYSLFFIGFGIIVILLSRGVLSNNLLVGSFLVTVIHVYIFTFLFMLYGALKSKSTPGLIASLLVVLVPIVIISLKNLPANYVISDWSKTIFIENNFHFLNLNLAKTFGLNNGDSFFFYEKPFLKIQTFLAFAYTYHYLNWFSKTSVIGWHKHLTKKSTAVITILWVVSFGLYAIDYRTGFILLVFLSTLHVFLEFPLNMVSIKGIIEEMKKRL